MTALVAVFSFQRQFNSASDATSIVKDLDESHAAGIHTPT